MLIFLNDSSYTMPLCFFDGMLLLTHAAGHLAAAHWKTQQVDSQGQISTADVFERKILTTSALLCLTLRDEIWAEFYAVQALQARNQ